MFEVRYDYMGLGRNNEIVEEYRSEFFEHDDGEAVANLLDELDEDRTVFCVEVLEDGLQTYIDLRDKKQVEGYIMRGVWQCC